MLQNNRIIYSNNSVLSDLSVGLNSYTDSATALAMVASGDYLFIGSDFPFNHRYFQIGTANNDASVVSVDTWDGVSWRACVDVIDQTSSSGMTLAQNGIISWVPDKTYSWQRMDTNYGSVSITGLSGVTIYDLYWVRLRLSADLDSGTTLGYVGHKFSNDSLLEVKYPDLLLSSVLGQFKTGKTSWNDQHIEASEFVINDLRARRVIVSPSQILNWELFTEAALQKVAEIVFTAFGQNFSEQATQCRALYQKAMASVIKHIDGNNNAILDPTELPQTQGWLTR